MKKVHGNHKSPLAMIYLYHKGFSTECIFGFPMCCNITSSAIPAAKLHSLC